MKKIKFKAYVTKQHLSGNMGINEPGIQEYDDFVEVEEIAFSGDEVDLIRDVEGNEYSFANNDLKAVISYSGFEDRNGTDMFEGDVFAPVIYDTNRLSSSSLRWEVFYNEEKLQFYARERTQDILKPLSEFRNSGIQYKVIGNVIKNPSLAVAD